MVEKMDVYDLFFSICLGLFIGGIIMSIISMILAEISTHDSSASGQLDHMDHVDHFDHVDHVDHFDHVDHVDHLDHIEHINLVDQIDHLDHMDHIDKYDHADSSKDFNHLDDTTPAPFMLLFSTSLLIFGISGIAFYYIIGELFRFSLFVITPIITYTITKLISVGWKKMAKSRYYEISSTTYQIGKEGEVILNVDKRGGVIKIPSQTPLKFEKLHVKPYRESDIFERGTKVYICDVQGDYLLVDTNKNSIRRRK